MNNVYSTSDARLTFNWYTLLQGQMCFGMTIGKNLKRCVLFSITIKAIILIVVTTKDQDSHVIFLPGWL